MDDHRSKQPQRGKPRDAGRTRASRSTQGDASGVQPRLPNERDESADSQSGGEPSGRVVGRQAMADVERGLADTSMAPVTDATYRRVKGRDDSGEAGGPRRTRKR